MKKDTISNQDTVTDIKKLYILEPSLESVLTTSEKIHTHDTDPFEVSYTPSFGSNTRTIMELYLTYTETSIEIHNTHKTVTMAKIALQTYGLTIIQEALRRIAVNNP